MLLFWPPHALATTLHAGSGKSKSLCLRQIMSVIVLFILQSIASSGTGQRHSLQEACVETLRSGQAHHAKKNHPYNCIMQARSLLQHTSTDATGY